MEADFTRFYGQDLRGLCWGENRWGVRRLLSHIKGLPRDSAFVRALSGVSAYWDENAELLAQIFDAMERQTYYLLKVNGNDPSEPVPLQRPGQKIVEPETVSLAEFSGFLNG
ncbi:hypothetical protein [Glaciihabitans sp. UYNi722]|uniref:hypothetical protein n=1 Tax=Glaciihabitans sp. UYNi722 TaxID=3156344 RepID=UPI003394A389